jgi:hypothetical protein
MAAMADEMGIQVHTAGSLEMTLDNIQDGKFRTGRMEDALPYYNRLSRN